MAYTHVLPDRLHDPKENGRVKDYAEQQDVTLEEAYRETIEAGLRAIEHPDEQ